MRHATAFISLILFLSITSYAATITVTNNNDSGPGSLREAVASSSNGDLIDFHSSTDGVTIFLTSGYIEVSKSIYIIGNGEDQTIIDGSNNSRVFHVLTSAKVTMKRVTIQNGSAASLFGGGVYNNGDLILEQCRIQNCVSQFGGGIGVSEGNLSIKECHIYNCVGTSFGGGVMIISGNSSDQLNVEQSLIENNISDHGGGVWASQVSTVINSSQILNNHGLVSGGGGFVNNNGLATIKSTQFFNNYAFLNGGAIDNRGHTEISNSVLSKNEAGADGGAIYTTSFGGTTDLATAITLENSTIAFNRGKKGGGIYLSNSGYNKESILDIGSSIISFNQSSSSVSNNEMFVIKGSVVGGPTVNDQGYNLISDTSGIDNFFPRTTLMGSNDDPLDPKFVSTDPLNCDLSLLCISPALNAGASLTTTVETDVDGNDRIQGDAIDIGAYEASCDIEMVPTLGEWSLIVLSLILMIFGVLAIQSEWINRNQNLIR